MPFYNLIPAALNGYVVDAETFEPLAGTNIRLGFTNEGTAANNTGYFKIENLSAGKHALRIDYMGYSSMWIFFLVNNADEEISQLIKMEPARIKIETSPPVENYHNYITSLERNKILEIHLDSLALDKNGLLTVYPYFYNKTDTPVYVIRDIPAVRMIKPVITNSAGDTLENNAAFSDFVGEKVTHDTSDFYRIDAHQYFVYPPVTIHLYMFNRYPEDDYTVRLIYTNPKREYLPGFNFQVLDKYRYKRTGWYYNVALRGSYASDNTLHFTNRELK